MSCTAAFSAPPSSLSQLQAAIVSKDLDYEKRCCLKWIKFPDLACLPHSPPETSAPSSVQDNTEDGEDYACSGEPGPPATPGSQVPTPILERALNIDLQNYTNTLQYILQVPASLLLLTYHVSSFVPWSYL